MLDYEIIDADIEEAEVVQNNKQASISSFIEDFGKSLLEAVSLQNPPVYEDVFKSVRYQKRAEVLDILKRKPFEAQQKVVQAVTTLLLDKGEKSAIINAEMGTGKTMMGIATSALFDAEGYKRTLIISPPHLVYKWRREILETVENPKVWILNGPDTLMKLVQFREYLRGNSNKEDQENKNPEFFILGRVRMRMGFHWKPAFAVRKGSGRRQSYASCPKCGEYVSDANKNITEIERFPTDKTYQCTNCNEPLWTLAHRNTVENDVDQSSKTSSLLKSLCEIPTIGKKRAELLIQKFGEDFIANMLGDNIHQFINLMDEKGEMVFSDAQALRMEKALSKIEFNPGQSDNYQPSEFIKRYLPKNFFSLLIIDECHEYKNSESAQGQAMGVIASQAKKILLLTGTLMGGYATDLFFLLWRIMPHRMIEDGYQYRRKSLTGASVNFMEQHGVLKRIHKSTDDHNHKTARGRRNSVKTSKAPGFGPKGIARYILPYTAFLKLSEIGNVLPPYHEHFIEVQMTEEQAEYYGDLKVKLTGALREALARGSTALLGLFMHCLLAWPDCCFREEIVRHPQSKKRLAYIPQVLDESPSPKEQEMIRLCKEAKAVNQKVLVYTTYTGTRDTAARLKSLLELEGFKAAVLRASVNTEKREDWICEQVDKGIDVLICNPELTKTGLDLLDFPQIIFMQSGFNCYTLMQASRRSWRIGQNLPVHVYFLGYSNTTQINCLKLMSKKIAVSQSTSGTMPESGLDVLNQDGDSIEVTLAKQLVA